MSSNEQSMIYSEVYGILDMLGKDYIDLIPKKLYNIIKENKNPNYTPIYDINKPLSKQNVKKRTASFMCMLHYNYWCKSDEEKREINEILEENHKNVKEKYSVENMFNNNKKEISTTEKIEITETKKEDKIQENTALVEKKENIFTKIINFIKGIFRRN